MNIQTSDLLNKLLYGQSQQSDIDISYLNYIQESQNKQQNNHQYSKNQQNNNQEKNEKKRWECLFEKGTRQKRTATMHEKVKNQVSQKEIEEYENMCTFQPQLISRQQSNYNNANMDISERSFLWQIQKQRKLEDLKRIDQDKDLIGCTFRPYIGESRNSVNTSRIQQTHQIQGVDKFLQKQRQARKNKDENLLTNRDLKTNITVKNQTNNNSFISRSPLKTMKNFDNSIQTNQSNMVTERENNINLNFQDAQKLLHYELHKDELEWEKKPNQQQQYDNNILYNYDQY